MRDQLIRYVDLLFAGAADAYDMKQEILQNTLDRYDDLVEQGKTPEAAYRLAISGIGDINEILGAERQPSACALSTADDTPDKHGKPVWKKLLRAVGICLYIMCPIPLFVLTEIGMDTVGLCGTLTFIAFATALMIICAEKNSHATAPVTSGHGKKLRWAVRSIIWILGLCAYFALSFALKAWYITWVIFPLTAAVQGLVMACMDLKEAK